MTEQASNPDQLCINTLRMLTVDAVNTANSGHPGMPMGAAPMAYVLWSRFLKHNPRNPAWFDRDRFVLSAGHGSMLLYGLLHLTGYDLSLEELKNFRQWGSRTAGHPEYGHTPGVETTTGPLGQGFANGVGMAMAERFLAARFNRPGHTIVDHYTYGIVGDGDLMEGISHEAASLAGHLKLGKLIYLYDDNHISIEGSTALAFTDDTRQRFKAYGWHVQQVADGNDLPAIEAALQAARADDRPSFIAVRTQIGFGSPNKQGAASVHGEPLGPEEARLTKDNLGWPLEPLFFIPEQALRHFRTAVDRGKEDEENWEKVFAAYGDAYPDLAAAWQAGVKGDLPDGWERDIPVFPADAKGMATRVASGKVLNAIAAKLPTLLGGSADLAPSNKTYISAAADFGPESYDQPNIRFGVREHGMGAIMNGLALHGGVIPYGGTFMVFSDYMRPAIRLASLMGLHVIYVFTHDSIGLGEDGPTHQPVEHLAALRVIPGLVVIRPAESNETAEAWRIAITHKEGPVALALSRQAAPTLDRDNYASAAGLARGGYVLQEVGESSPALILIATGTEISLILAAAVILEKRGVSSRLVSMPSWELFEEQSSAYKDSVLPPRIKTRVAVEAGCSQGWHRYVGDNGAVIGINHFGASAPAKVLYEKFGLSADHIVDKVLAMLK